MEWVTREHSRIDRIACPWLIRKFIDPAAKIVYVAAGDVLAYRFALLEVDDQRQLELELPVYDALYAWAVDQLRTA